METAKKKRIYSCPEINAIKIDHEISLVMMSAGPGGDPEESIQPDHFSINPFKFIKL